MTSYHLTDALPMGALPTGFNLARSALDRAGTIDIDDGGVTLHGLVPTRVTWEEMSRVDVASRLDTVVGLGLGLLPVTRIPGVRSVVESLVDRAATTVASGAYQRAREAAGWRLVRFVLDHGAVDVKRGPSLVVTLYPRVTREIERQARQHDVPVERIRRLR